MEKKEIRIGLIYSVYCLFLYFLICGVNENDIIIISRAIPESIRKNFKHVYFKEAEDEKLNSARSPLDRKIIRMKLIARRMYETTKLRILLFFKTRNKKVKVYGQGNLQYSFPIYEYEDSYMIEDGLANYLDLPYPEYYPPISRKIYNFFGIHYKNYYAGFGTHENIKKVLLTRNTPPEIIKDKIEVINLKHLWDSKTKNEQKNILEIFNIKNIFDDFKEPIILLLTECLHQDNFIPFDEEMNIYKYLINKQKNKNIIMKTHPRNKMDYRKIFPKMTIIDQPFPLEILKCADINIEKIITVSSSAALNFTDICEIEFYDKKTSNDELNSFIDAFKKQISNNILNEEQYE